MIRSVIDKIYHREANLELFSKANFVVTLIDKTRGNTGESKSFNRDKGREKEAIT